jgi:hypothetical protein
MMRPEKVSSTTQRPLDDEERELMNPDTWDWDSSEEGVPNPNIAFTFEVRFAGDALKRLTRAARAEKSTVHAFIERLVLAHLDEETAASDERREAM